MPPPSWSATYTSPASSSPKDEIESFVSASSVDVHRPSCFLSPQILPEQ